MKKVLKNILKWLVCVFLTFSVVFTISQTEEIADGLHEQAFPQGDEEIFEQIMEYPELVIGMEEDAENIFNQSYTEESIKQLYIEHPIGIVRAYEMISRDSFYDYMCGSSSANSIILGLIIGTIIYLLIDKEQKGLKTVVITYILVIVISGFVEGMGSIINPETLFDYWDLSSEYMLLATIAFGLVMLLRYERQKNIADKLNEKLKTKKEEKADK